MISNFCLDERIIKAKNEARMNEKNYFNFAKDEYLIVF